MQARHLVASHQAIFFDVEQEDVFTAKILRLDCFATMPFGAYIAATIL